MILQYILLAIFLIASVKVMILFFNKENLLLMRKFLKTGDPKEWMDSENFASNVIWVLVASVFACYSFGFMQKIMG